jgi:hypothetical protein
MEKERNVDLLDHTDFDCFRKYGYVVIKQAFSKETAALCKDRVWEHMSTYHGVCRQDASTWVPKVSLDKVWMENEGAPWKSVFTLKCELHRISNNTLMFLLVFSSTNSLYEFTRAI